MSSVDGRTSADWRRPAQLERDLVGQIQAAAGELQRIECLDDEQRAEIHAILEAMAHDTQTHAHIIGSYVSEKGDA